MTQQPSPAFARKANAKYFSSALGKTIEIQELLSSKDFEFLESVLAEVDSEAQEVNVELNTAKKKAAAYGQFLKPEIFEKLDRRRRNLAAFQQPLQRHVGRLRRELNQDHSYRLAVALQGLLSATTEEDLRAKMDFATQTLAEFWRSTPSGRLNQDAPF